MCASVLKLSYDFLYSRNGPGLAYIDRRVLIWIHLSVVKQKGTRKKKQKKKSKKDKPSTSKAVAEARWLDKSESQNDQLNKEGKVDSVVPGRKSRTGSPGRQRKQMTSTTAR